MRVFLTGFCFVAVSTGFLSFASLAQGGLAEDERATRLRQQDVASLVPDNISYSLPWGTIMERDILWKKRVWRDIDATKELNAAFAPGPQNPANILLGGAQKGKLTTINADGKEQDSALFWIYYPDTREYLAQFKANTNANWDQVLQSRNFGSKITSVVDSRMPR